MPETANQTPVSSDVNRGSDGKFLPGNNANPKGRPKVGISFVAAIERMAHEQLEAEGNAPRETRAERMARIVWEMALSGDRQAMRELMSRFWPEKLDINHTGTVEHVTLDTIAAVEQTMMVLCERYSPDEVRAALQ